MSASAARNQRRGATTTFAGWNQYRGSFLAPQPVGLTGAVAHLLADPAGFDRALVAPTHERIVAFMRRHLLP